MRTFTNKKAVPVKQTAKQKLQYVRKNWQLYLFFLMPALLLTIIFKYIPMSGVLIAFEDYNVIDGVFGSEWVGLELIILFEFYILPLQRNINFRSHSDTGLGPDAVS